MNMDIKKTVSELTLEEKAGLCSGSGFARTKAVERLGIPAVMMFDGPHGLRKQDGKEDHLGLNESIKAVCFPAACALASSFDEEVAENVGETLGRECQAEHLAMLLGPGVNIKRSPLCGRDFEYYSEDPYLAGKLGAAMVRGIQSQGASACVKHYTANNQETLRMSGNSVVDERTLNEIYLSPFETVIKEAHPKSVMCAYNKVNGTFMSENRKLLTDILRGKWGFDGFVVTDWGAVKDRVTGIKAGVDLEMPGDGKSNTDKIVAAVKNGTLAEAELDAVVENILKFVAWASEHQKEDVIFDREADYRVAADAAKECAVLLKNDGAVLPLRKDAEVAFIGEFAVSPRYQGSGSSHVNSQKVVSALDAASGLNITYAQGYRSKETATDETLLREAVEAAKAAKAAVLFVGLPETFETEGADRTILDLPGNQNELVAAVSAVQPNTVVVLYNGAPVTMPWADSIPSILELYLAGDGAGEATVALLFGDANPSGKLAETFPKKLSDTPSYLNFPGDHGRVEYHEGVFVGYRYYDKKEMDVLFPFGHGLSYTSFAYSDLKMDKNDMKDTEEVSVSVFVKNTGSRFGKEAVQLYVCDVESTPVRPQRELKGFAKVGLNPGESKVVSFKLSKRAFAYYDTRMHDFVVETGEFLIEIGSSSRDIRLSSPIKVYSTTVIPIKFTRNSTMGDVMQSPKGQALMASLKQNMPNGAEDQANAMGGGASAMIENMMKEIPLASLISYGKISEEQLEGILQMLNS